MNKQKQLDQFRETLRTQDRRALRKECQKMFASGIELHDISRVVMEKIAEDAVADPSWLPAASIVNQADSFAQVGLQSIGDKHMMVCFSISRQQKSVRFFPIFAGTGGYRPMQSHYA